MSMLETIENEVQLQLMAALDGQNESDFRLALLCRIDDLRAGRTDNQSHALDGCWTPELQAEVAERLAAIRDTHYTTALGY